MNMRSSFLTLVGLVAAVGAVAQQPVSLTQGELKAAPAIIAGHAGAFVVLWSEAKTPDSTTKDFNVFVQEFSGNGSANGARLMVNEAFAGQSISPAGAHVGGGRFVFAWVDSVRKDGRGAIKARTFDTSTKVLGPIVTLSPSALPAGSPIFTSDPEGTCLLTFTYLLQANEGVHSTACLVLSDNLKPLSQTTTLKSPDGSHVQIKRGIASCRPGVWSIPSFEWSGSTMLLVSRSDPSGFGPLVCDYSHAPTEANGGRSPEWGACLSEKDAFAWLVRVPASKGGFMPDDPFGKSGTIPLGNGRVLVRGTSIPGRPAEGRMIMADCHGNKLWQTELQELAVAIPSPQYLHMSALHQTVLAVRGEKAKSGPSIASAVIVCGADIFAKPPARPKIAEILLPAGSSPGTVAATPLFAGADSRQPVSVVASWTTVRFEKRQRIPSTHVSVYPVVWREMKSSPAGK